MKKQNETRSRDSGFLHIYKPAGINSTRMVSMVKKKLNLRKIGHTGTLDNFAEGLMILPYGSYTAFADYFLGMDKSYIAEIKFGSKTDSGDCNGEIMEQWDDVATSAFFQAHAEELRQSCEQIKNLTSQVAPKISALKVNGKRQSDLFRSGIEFADKTRKITIYSLQTGDWSEKGFSMHVHVSSGTYIRKLIADLSDQSGFPMHITRLIRTSIGSFKLDTAWQMQDIESGKYEVMGLESIGLLQIQVSAAEAEKIRHGQYPPIVDIPQEQDFILVDGAGKGVAYCSSKTADSRRKYRFKKVFQD